MKNISLDSGDFYGLVSGEVLEKDGVQICLQDIGYDIMLNNIDHAIQNRPSRVKNEM